MTSLFNKPAEATRADKQTLVPAGAFLLVADPHELSFARLAAELCDSNLPAPGPMGRFSRLARRAASALGIDAPNRAKDWTRAFVSASDMLLALGPLGPAKGAIPLEIHSHGFLSLARELKDLFSLIPALQREEARQPVSGINTKTGVVERQIVRSEAPTADGIAVAARIHAIVKFAGPSYFDSHFGLGTDRLLIGTGNSNRMEALIESSGQHIQAALNEPLHATIAGKTFVLLHESFHLSQSWQAQSDGTMLNAIFPEPMRHSGSLADKSQAFWKLQFNNDKARIGDRWMMKTLQESYADLMAAVAFGKKDPQRVSLVAAGVRDWRLGVSALSKTQKPSLGERLLKSVIKTKEPDPHQTEHALAALQELIASGSITSNDDALRWSEAAKTCAHAGFLRLCAQRAETAAAVINRSSPKPSENDFSNLRLASKAIKTLLTAAKNPVAAPVSDLKGLCAAARAEADKALRQFNPDSAPAPLNLSSFRAGPNAGLAPARPAHGASLGGSAV